MSTTIHRRNFLKTAAAGAAVLSAPSFAQERIVLKGATYFNNDHSFNRAMLKFGELVEQYSGAKVKVDIHGNGELGNERDYIKFMGQGISVDFAMLAASNLSNVSKVAPLVDVPFLFRDREHFRKAAEVGALDRYAEIVEKQSGIMVLGLGGGAVRNIVANRPVRSLAELKGLKMRVLGAPIQAKMFAAFGVNPSVIAYSETFNAIQSAVVDGLENESPAIEQMKFYEVAGDLSQTQHVVAARPLLFSSKRFRTLPPQVQQAVRRAGKEAAAYHRVLDVTEDDDKLKKLAADRKLRIHSFGERDKLVQLAQPVWAEYAREIGAEDILAAVRAVK